jgi:hypothetical protein
MNARPHKVNKRKRQTWRRILIAVGSIIATCCVCVGAVAVADGSGLLNTPTPLFTANNNSIEALISYTQTAAAQIPITGPTATETPPPTETTPDPSTAASSQSLTSTITNTPTATHTPLPTQTRIPTFTSIPPLPALDLPQGITAICNDGTYSYSQHRRGTCSHHGGVKEWINRPPN